MRVLKRGRFMFLRIYTRLLCWYIRITSVSIQSDVYVIGTAIELALCVVEYRTFR